MLSQVAGGTVIHAEQPPPSAAPCDLTGTGCLMVFRPLAKAVFRPNWHVPGTAWVVPAHDWAYTWQLRVRATRVGRTGRHVPSSPQRDGMGLKKTRQKQRKRSKVRAKKKNEIRAYRARQDSTISSFFHLISFPSCVCVVFESKSKEEERNSRRPVRDRIRQSLRSSILSLFLSCVCVVVARIALAFIRRDRPHSGRYSSRRTAACAQEALRSSGEPGPRHHGRRHGSKPSRQGKLRALNVTDETFRVPATSLDAPHPRDLLLQGHELLGSLAGVRETRLTLARHQRR